MLSFVFARKNKRHHHHLVQEVLGRFARTEEIRELAPRIARGWKAEGVFAGCNDTGRETPEFKVLRRELRDSHEFREALTFGENSEATSALRRAELLEFVQHNLDCANSTGVMGDCSMIQAIDMPDLASLWNSIGPLLGGASSRLHLFVFVINHPVHNHFNFVPASLARLQHAVVQK